MAMPRVTVLKIEPKKDRINLSTDAAFLAGCRLYRRATAWGQKRKQRKDAVTGGKTPCNAPRVFAFSLQNLQPPETKKSMQSPQRLSQVCRRAVIRSDDSAFGLLAYQSATRVILYPPINQTFQHRSCGLSAPIRILQIGQVAGAGQKSDLHQN